MKKKTVLEHVLDSLTVLTIIVTVLFAIGGIIFNIVYVKTSVIGYSMSPTLNSTVPSADIEGDTVFINKYSKIENNDIVVANVAWWNLGPIIKRVVASPGDVLQLKEENENYNLYVNGKLFQSKPKTTEATDKTGSTQDFYFDYQKFILDPNNSNNVIEINGEKHIIMNENEFFLIGDNWGESTDSMQKGPVKAEKIVGKVEIVASYGEEPIWTMIGEIIKLIFVPNWI